MQLFGKCADRNAWTLIRDEFARRITCMQHFCRDAYPARLVTCLAVVFECADVRKFVHMVMTQSILERSKRSSRPTAAARSSGFPAAAACGLRLHVVAGASAASHPTSRTTPCRSVRPRPTMQHDEVIWQVINQNFCSFKIKYENEIECTSCPASHPSLPTLSDSPRCRHSPILTRAPHSRRAEQ
jgi:hypothetical protein